MEDSLNSITTEQAQNGSSLLVVDLDSMPNHTLESEADNSIPPLRSYKETMVTFETVLILFHCHFSNFLAGRVQSKF